MNFKIYLIAIISFIYLVCAAGPVSAAGKTKQVKTDTKNKSVSMYSPKAIGGVALGTLILGALLGVINQKTERYYRQREFYPSKGYHPSFSSTPNIPSSPMVF